MFPIADDNRGQRITPYVTYTLIALNVLAFLFQLSLEQRQLASLFASYGSVPAVVSDGERLHSVLTSMFLHGGWLHLAGNMLFLWVFGDNIEDIMGHVRYLLFYLLCGFAAAGLQVAVNPDSQIPMVGASGAISGVLAAYVVLFPRGKIRTVILLGWFPLVFLFPAWLQIGYWIVLQFLNGFLTIGVNTAETGGGVAYFAHIGGFLAGALLVLALKDDKALARQRRAHAGERAFQRVSLTRG